MNLKPGIYMATVRGVPDQIIKVVEPETYGATCTVHTPDGKCVCHEAGKVTDARPLITLDMKEPDLVVTYLRRTFNTRLIGIADQIEAQTHG